jgi:hypothetical protein
MSNALSVHHLNQSTEAREEDMAKTKVEKTAATMRKEWWVSKSTDRSVNELIAAGVLHNRELAGWRLSVGDSYPDPEPGEIVVFEDFFKRGFGVPVHPFIQGLCLYYEIGICNLHPNSILLVCLYPFRYLFCLRKKGS